MKKVILYLIISLTWSSTNWAQGLSADSSGDKSILNLTAPTHEIISKLASFYGYHAKFIGKDSLLHRRHVYAGRTDKITEIFDWLNYHYYDFAYVRKGDTFVIDDYIVYNLSTANTADSFLCVKYDSIRKGQVFAFENVSPLAVLDTLRGYLGSNEIIDVTTEDKVSGIIPLNVTGYAAFPKILRTHRWKYGFNGKTGVIRKAPPDYEDVKGHYAEDSVKIVDSSYIIYTTEKKTNTRFVTFKHLELPELFKIIEKNNGYRIDHEPFFKQKYFASGTLPLEMPITTFTKLICLKHNLVFIIHDATKPLIVFAQAEEQLWDYSPF